jgi:hypothetical protein
VLVTRLDIRAAIEQEPGCLFVAVEAGIVERSPAVLVSQVDLDAHLQEHSDRGGLPAQRCPMQRPGRISLSASHLRKENQQYCGQHAGILSRPSLADDMQKR